MCSWWVCSQQYIVCMIRPWIGQLLVIRSRMSKGICIHALSSFGNRFYCPHISMWKNFLFLTKFFWKLLPFTLFGCEIHQKVEESPILKIWNAKCSRDTLNRWPIVWRNTVCTKKILQTIEKYKCWRFRLQSISFPYDLLLLLYHWRD